MLKRKGAVEIWECAAGIMVHWSAFFNCLLLWTVSSRITAQSTSGLVTTCLVELIPSKNLSLSKVYTRQHNVHCKIITIECLYMIVSLSSEYF